MTSILTPVLALVIWSLIVWVWMYATRIPAIQAAKIDPANARFPDSLDVLPDRVRGVADNYNHLMEQPTIFYALVFYAYLTGGNDLVNIVLAWSYVILRVVHSLIQGTVNKVMWRFPVHVISTIPLFIIAARSLWLLWR